MSRKDRPVSMSLEKRSGCFQARAALEGFAHVLDRHVVEEKGFGSVGNREFHFLQLADFDFDGLRTTAVVMRALERGHDSSGERDVIVLNQHTIGKVEAVILAATATNAVFVDGAQAGNSFARIENARLGAANRFHELARQRRDTTHTLQKIEDYPFAGKDDACVVADHGHGLAGVDANAVENFGMAGHFVVRNDSTVEHGEDVENRGDDTESCENAVLFGDDCSGCSLVRIDAGVTGGVARGAIFQQRVLQDGGNASAVPVHGNQVSGVRSWV